MELSSILFVSILLLAATALCVMVFERLGFGSVLGFIVAGIIVGPNTPGPVASEHLDELQQVSEMGVVLFLFIIGLEVRPERLWAMRRLLFGLGGGQVIISAVAITGMIALMKDVNWSTAIILGLGFAMSSTAIIMTTMEQRGQLRLEHGRAAFAVLLAQDLAIIPIMALIPILGHQATASGPGMSYRALVGIGALAGILVAGRWILPILLRRAARRHNMAAFGTLLFLAVIAAAWIVQKVGISMTLGAFLMGMVLSSSDYRYQIEAIVAPYKDVLMGLFFISVGMAIDVKAMVQDWSALLVSVPAILTVKLLILLSLALIFKVKRGAALRTAFYLSQVGEFAFVLFGAASTEGLLHPYGLTLSSLAIAVSMIATPLMIKIGDRLALWAEGGDLSAEIDPAVKIDRHVVIAGYNEVGQVICMLLQQATIPFLVLDEEHGRAEEGRRLGHPVHFGNLQSPVTRKSTEVGKASAVFIAVLDPEKAKALALTLHGFYPNLPLYTRVRNFLDVDELEAHGIANASPMYVMSALYRGGKLLKDLGVPEPDVDAILDEFQKDDLARVRYVAAA